MTKAISILSSHNKQIFKLQFVSTEPTAPLRYECSHHSLMTLTSKSHKITARLTLAVLRDLCMHLSQALLKQDTYNSVSRNTPSWLLEISKEEAAQPLWANCARALSPARHRNASWWSERTSSFSLSPLPLTVALDKTEKSLALPSFLPRKNKLAYHTFLSILNLKEPQIFLSEYLLHKICIVRSPMFVVHWLISTVKTCSKNPGIQGDTNFLWHNTSLQFKAADKCTSKQRRYLIQKPKPGSVCIIKVKL